MNTLKQDRIQELIAEMLTLWDLYYATYDDAYTVKFNEALDELHRLERS